MARNSEARARSSSAPTPRVMVKRGPESLVARVKSKIPKASPSSTWSLGENENAWGVPTLRISVADSSESPPAVSSRGRFGISRRNCSNSCWICPCSVSSKGVRTGPPQLQGSAVVPRRYPRAVLDLAGIDFLTELVAQVRHPSMQTVSRDRERLQEGMPLEHSVIGFVQWRTCL